MISLTPHLEKGMESFETPLKKKKRSGTMELSLRNRQLHGVRVRSGRVGGKQTVSLGAGCVYFGIILHELMHAVGFWHEQSRADRNDYVRINWGNIRNGMEYNFQKYDWTIIQNLGVNYDTGIYGITDITSEISEYRSIFPVIFTAIEHFRLPKLFPFSLGLAKTSIFSVSFLRPF
ncbi:Zinc metalloproteinase nas-13 [Armadillidium vulgare]|nr:Zinc metalloproteinase nas-13 [Armadillidium vulgare]